MVPPEVFLAFSAVQERSSASRKAQSLDSFSPCGKRMLSFNHGSMVP